MPPAARVADMTQHGPPLAPGPGSTTVLIGFMPAWRALPAGVGDGLESASEQMKGLMDSPVLTPANATPKLVQMQQGLVQAAGQAAAKGNPAAVATTTSACITLNTTNVSLTTAWTSASAVPGGQPAANTAYTEGIKAAAAATASAVFSAVAGLADTHICPIPCPIPPHGPGVVTKGSASVFIDNLPAARQDDKVVEACGGSDPIAMGCQTVIIGDEKGSGGGGGAGGSGASGTSTTEEASSSESVEEEAQAVAEAMPLAAESATALVGIDQLDPTAEPATDLAYIEFRVVNEATGLPRSGVRLHIRGPDEKEYRVSTNNEGRAVLNGVPDGDYTIERTEEAPMMEVVRLESSPRPPRSS